MRIAIPASFGPKFKYRRRAGLGQTWGTNMGAMWAGRRRITALASDSAGRAGFARPTLVNLGRMSPQLQLGLRLGLRFRLRFLSYSVNSRQQLLRMNRLCQQFEFMALAPRFIQQASRCRLT